MAWKDLSDMSLLYVDTRIGMLTLSTIGEKGHRLDNLFNLPTARFSYYGVSKRLFSYRKMWLELVASQATILVKEGAHSRLTTIDIFSPKDLLGKDVQYIKFKVVAQDLTEKALKASKKVKGFRNVVADDDYFDKIPLVNELYHVKEGRLTSARHTIAHLFKEGWDKLEAGVLLNYDGEEYQNLNDKSYNN